MIVTRFAPSPNGSLHLGHAYSAIVAHDLAKRAGGEFLLRIEDIDGARSHPEFADEFRDDLNWLGLEWREVPSQSTRIESYEQAANFLLDEGLVYPCICSRSDIQRATPAIGLEGTIYPGTCKSRDVDMSQPHALRLDLEKAMRSVKEIAWTDQLAGTFVADPRDFGDVVLVRKDEPASYHLATTIDDAIDGVTLVTRGSDLFSSTHIHRLLQELLGLAVPEWYHHTLLVDPNGKKLAKSRNSPSLADRRRGGEDGLLLAEQLRLHRLPSGISFENA